MKKLLMIVAALCLTASVAAAQDPFCYSWEDGGTVLGAYLPDFMYLANDGSQAYHGSYSLEIYETGGTGTPQAYVAWITGLREGDTVSASIWTYDPSIGANPSVRIWGHWTLAGGTIDDYYGSAGGNNTYSGGESWVELTQTWTAGAANDGMGLVVEIRPYNSSPWAGSNWVDYLCITKPENAFLYFPGGTVSAGDSSWGAVKALFQ